MDSLNTLMLTIFLKIFDNLIYAGLLQPTHSSVLSL